MVKFAVFKTMCFTINDTKFTKRFKLTFLLWLKGRQRYKQKGTGWLIDRQTNCIAFKFSISDVCKKWFFEVFTTDVLLLIKQRIFTFIVTIPFIIYSSKLPVHRRKNPLFQITFVLEYTRNFSTIWKLIVGFCLMFNSSAFFFNKGNIEDYSESVSDYNFIVIGNCGKF